MLTMDNQIQVVITFGFEIPFCKAKMGTRLDYRAFQCEKGMIPRGYSIFFKFLRKIVMEDPYQRRQMI